MHEIRGENNRDVLHLLNKARTSKSCNLFELMLIDAFPVQDFHPNLVNEEGFLNECPALILS